MGKVDSNLADNSKDNRAARSKVARSRAALNAVACIAPTVAAVRESTGAVCRMPLAA